jgi:large subunit ribosomal protein L29
MKSQEIHKMNAEELKVEQRRLRDRLFELKSQAVTEKLDNPRELTKTRRDIARILTEIRAREIQEAKA